MANIEEDRESSLDTSGEGMEELVQKWIERFGSSPARVSDLVEIGQDITSLPVYRTKEGKIDRKSFGKMLRKNRNRVFSGATICSESGSNGQKRWNLKGDFTEKTDQNYLPYSDPSDNGVF